MKGDNRREEAEGVGEIGDHGGNGTFYLSPASSATPSRGQSNQTIEATVHCIHRWKPWLATQPYEQEIYAAQPLSYSLPGAVTGYRDGLVNTRGTP